MRWIWIDRFTHFETGIRATAVKNVSLAEEYLHDHFPGFAIMPACLMIEGMAQTAGILVGEARNFENRVILAKVQKATFDDIVRPGDQLHYEAEIESLGDAGATTLGRIKKNGNFMGTVNLMFSHLAAGQRSDIPDHNFVFTDQFRELLRGYRNVSTTTGPQP